jgi:hypothetical protein
MRLPDIEHTSRPWRIHELTRDFRVEHVWALPVAGGRDDFPRLVAQLAVLVEPDGMLGAGYMAAIKPFRNLIVYPRMMQDMGRRWRDGASSLLAHAARRGSWPDS